MLDLWGQSLIYFYCSLLKKQKTNTPPFLWQVSSVKVLICMTQASSVFGPSSPTRGSIGVLAGRGVRRPAGRLISSCFCSLSLVIQCLTLQQWCRAIPALPEVFVSIALCGFGENENSLGKAVPLESMSFSCYECVKVKCMWIYYICTIKVFD